MQNDHEEGSVAHQLAHIKQQKEALIERYLNTRDTLQKQEIEEKIRQLKEQREEIMSNLLERLTSEVSFPSLTNKKEEETIIDVTGNSIPISYTNDHLGLTKFKGRIPSWKHQNIYSYSDIEYATTAQKQFYRQFKRHFQQDEYIDLEGNENYAFVLLYDLKKEFKLHQNLDTLERQYDDLAQFYPKIAPYAHSIVVKEKKAQDDGINPSNQQWSGAHYYDYYWKLGAKYKKKLNLDTHEVSLLNFLWENRTVFGNIEFCYQEILKLYLRVLKALEKAYRDEKDSLNQRFQFVADGVVRKQYRYRKGSWNYTYTFDSTLRELYFQVFKHCENEVRTQYQHKRKLNTKTLYSNRHAQAAFEENIGTKIIAILPTLTATIQAPDEATEIELNALTTTRWKAAFKTLTNHYNKLDPFLADIHHLGKLNAKNPSVEHIFFDASKFLAQHDKIASLKLYIHYLYYDLHSEVINRKPHNKTILKKLFSNEEQLKAFETIVNHFLQDKDLDKALQVIPSIYAVKRKKIQLNTNIIKEVQEQHSSTIELLNEYLQDPEEEKASLEPNAPHKEAEAASVEDNNNSSIFNSNLNFSDLQLSTLELFVKSNLNVSRSDLEAFANSQGAFKNQLIDTINELCYDLVDDVLIEEDGEDYIIYDQYYQKILNNNKND